MVPAVTPPVNIRYASLTDVGVKRAHNQDACASQPAADVAHWQSHGHVFVVADGMGGHAVGEKASAKAVRDIPLTYLKYVVAEGVGTAIRRSFQEANEGIFSIGVNNPEFKGLGTTATALFLRPEGAWIGHVGDSRAYRIRNGRIQQLTFDHSWVWEIARRQGIDPDELGDFKKNVIIRSLGPDAEVEVDVEGPHPVEPGDSFLLCSDGLTNVVSPDEIGAVVANFPPEEASKYLIGLANIRGGPDNITCLIVEVPGDSKAKANTPKRSQSLRKVLTTWNRVIPWPFSLLGLGVITAMCSVWLRSEELPGAMIAFILAAVLIVGGLVGLYLHLRSRSEETESEPGTTSSELRLYRDYKFDIDEAFVNRFTEIATGLKENVQNQKLELDWEPHSKHESEAEAAIKRSDWTVAFRERFLAIQLLANEVSKRRNKDEVFQPNWTTPHRAIG